MSQDMFLPGVGIEGLEGLSEDTLALCSDCASSHEGYSCGQYGT